MGKGSKPYLENSRSLGAFLKRRGGRWIGPTPNLANSRCHGAMPERRGGTKKGCKPILANIRSLGAFSERRCGTAKGSKPTLAKSRSLGAFPERRWETAKKDRMFARVGLEPLPSSYLFPLPSSYRRDVRVRRQVDGCFRGSGYNPFFWPPRSSGNARKITTVCECRR